MAATLAIVEYNGASPGTPTTVTMVNFGTKDMLNPIVAGAADYNPIFRPSSGFNYSYWKSLGLKATGTFTDIRNIRWAVTTDPIWSLGTGGEKRIGNRDTGGIGCPLASYAQSIGTAGTTGNAIEAALTNGHAYYNAQTVPTKTWGSWPTSTPATIDSTPYTAAFTSNLAVLQLKIASDVTDANCALLTGGQFEFLCALTN